MTVRKHDAGRVATDQEIGREQPGYEDAVELRAPACLCPSDDELVITGDHAHVGGLAFDTSDEPLGTYPLQVFTEFGRVDAGATVARIDIRYDEAVLVAH